MPFEIGPAIVAGLVATTVMTAIMYMGLAMMPRQMPMNMLYMMGTMMMRASAPAYMIGAMMHFGIGVVFAIVHTALYQAFGIETGLAVWGIMFGFVHWIIASMGMGMMGSMHPLIRGGEMAAPGPFLKDFPRMSIMGFLMLHLIFGVVVALVYDSFV